MGRGCMMDLGYSQSLVRMTSGVPLSRHNSVTNSLMIEGRCSSSSDQLCTPARQLQAIIALLTAYEKTGKLEEGV